MADRFWVWPDDERPEDAREFSFSCGGFHDAAEAWAEWAWDNNDGWEWLKTGQEVNVRDETGAVTRVEITVEFDPVFTATKARPIDQPPPPPPAKE